MTDELMELGRRAVACKGWRWMPGMLTSSPSSPYEMHRVISSGLGCTHLTTGRYQAGGVVEQSGPMASSLLPDLTDPATLGCLLALVREVCGPLACTYIQSDVPSCWIVRTVHYEYYDGTRAEDHGYSEHSEAEALVAALEAAP